MRALFAVGGLYTEASGVARIVCDLANALARSGAEVGVYTARCNGHRTVDHLLAPPSKCVAEPGNWLGRLSRSPRLNEALERDVPSYQVVHCHSVWMLPNHYAAYWARRYDRPLLFSAHGALEPWALARSALKKRLVGLWFQNRDLRAAACLHVNSQQEATSLRAYGLRNPIAIVPNGVDLSALASLPPRTQFEASFPETKGKQRVLFLGRLHPKKGVVPLIQAWSRLREQDRDWHLVVAGPDDGLEAESRRMIHDLEVSDSVSMTGALYGDDKLAALAAADAFILPSFSEGFSMSVLEAMACGLPVLITPGCNFPEIRSAGAGIEITPDAHGIEQGLRKLFSMSSPQRKEMGHLGRRMVERSYTWDAVARQMIQIYEWLLGGGATPATVHAA